MNHISHHILELSEIRNLIDKNNDFLLQIPILKTQPELNTESIQNPQTQIYAFECQNPMCQMFDRIDEIESFHNYEIESDQIVTICNDCYDRGYRMCLFTHEIHHLEQLDIVLDQMYALKKYHQNQLNPDILTKISDLDQYLHQIGIDDPNPRYSHLFV